MPTAISNLAAQPNVLKGLQFTTISSLAILSGIAASLELWVMPIIFMASTARTKTRQFTEVITRGARYLQPTSTILGLSLASLTYLISQHPDPATAARWKYYALSLACLIPVAPYEILTIFPTNDRVIEIGNDLERKKQDNLDPKGEEELTYLLKKWQRRHIGRIIMPMAAAMVALWDVVSHQSS